MAFWYLVPFACYHFVKQYKSRMGLWLVRPLLSWSDWEMERRPPWLIRIDWIQTFFITRIHQILWHYGVRDFHSFGTLETWCHFHDSKALVAFLLYRFILSTHTTHWDNIIQKPGHNHKQWKTEANSGLLSITDFHCLSCLHFDLYLFSSETPHRAAEAGDDHSIASLLADAWNTAHSELVLSLERSAEIVWDCYSLADYPSIILNILKALVIKSCELLQYINPKLGASLQAWHLWSFASFVGSNARLVHGMYS